MLRIAVRREPSGWHGPNTKRASSLYLHRPRRYFHLLPFSCMPADRRQRCYVTSSTTGSPTWHNGQQKVKGIHHHCGSTWWTLPARSMWLKKLSLHCNQQFHLILPDTPLPAAPQILSLPPALRLSRPVPRTCRSATRDSPILIWVLESHCQRTIPYVSLHTLSPRT